MLIDPASWGLLDPLLEASLEIGVLEDHLDLVESQVVYLQKSHRLQLDTYIKKEQLTPDDPEWHEALQHHYHWIDFLLPRFLRGPFLVSLYAVYESVVTEVADVMRDRVSESRRLAEYGAKNLSFLQRAAKYYREVLAFDLCLDPTTWERLDALRELRNALAHANGRLDVLQAKQKRRINKIVSEFPGVQVDHGCLIFDQAFVAETARLVKTSLEDLVARSNTENQKAKNV